MALSNYRAGAVVAVSDMKLARDFYEKSSASRRKAMTLTAGAPAVQQGGEQRDFVGLGAHLQLAQHHAMSMIKGGEQVAAILTAMPGPA